MLRGKNAIITGARRGIGKETVEMFAKNGCNIWACARKEDLTFESEIQELAEKYGVWIKPIYFDLTSEEAIKNGFKQIYSERKNIDILVNNAGIVHTQLFQMTSFEQIHEVYQVNVFAMMQLSQLALKVMSRKKTGVIINIASVAGQDANPTNTIYGSSKAAVISFTRTLASEVASQGIRVNAVAPGPTDTEMVQVVKEKVGDAVLNNCAMERLAKPSEIANVIMFLASEQASFVNGQVIRTDGGAR